MSLAAFSGLYAGTPKDLEPGGTLKLLLTSAGVNNPSIGEALLDLLDKPIAEANALCIPTALYAHPWCGPASAWRFIAGQMPPPMVELGWESVGLIELTALPSIDTERWVPLVRKTDVLLVSAATPCTLPLDARVRVGRPLGLARDTVWIGMSAGSMVMTPRSARSSSDGLDASRATTGARPG